MVPFRHPSSPRERGCFLHRPTTGQPRHVLPARAGVLPNGPTLSSRRSSPPRASGGASGHGIVEIPKFWSSPRERGCFRVSWICRIWRFVLPARAGVLPLLRLAEVSHACPPRASGGASQVKEPVQRVSASSPRERGCFQTGQGAATVPRVLPARAGVLPSGAAPSQRRMSPPRASGGASHALSCVGGGVWSSPRERGCFLHLPRADRRAVVLPARAGVLPGASRMRRRHRRPPRASGGASSW